MTSFDHDWNDTSILPTSGKKIVVSLCGGTDSAYLSCIDAGIDVSPTGEYEYHTFETDKYASAVSKHNIPHAIHHGDANGWRELLGRDVFLLIAGFPCQPYSVAGKQLGTSDSRDLSKVMYDALQGLNPDYFLLENVESKAKHEWLKNVSQIRQAEMYTHDSAKVSAQSRKRVYITNIPHNELADQGTVLNDVLEDGAMADRDKSYCIDANYFKGGSMKMYYEKARRQIVYVQDEKIAIKSKKCRQVGEADLKGYDIIKRVYSRWGKSPTLTTMQGGWRMPKVETDELHWRALTPLECERLQTLPDGWTKYGVFGDKLDVVNISNSQRYKMIGNGFTRAVISHILEGVYT
tara:strand:- start:1859 stop:2908 length:1050 start_codon:yes stop_codon:yes gene_type:complete